MTWFGQTANPANTATAEEPACLRRRVFSYTKSSNFLYRAELTFFYFVLWCGQNQASLYAEGGGITVLVKVSIMCNSFSEESRQVKGEIVIGGKQLLFTVEPRSSIAECLGEEQSIERTRELIPITVCCGEEIVPLSNQEYEALFCSIGIMAISTYETCTTEGIPFKPYTVHAVLSLESEFCKKLAELGYQFLDETVGATPPN